MIDETSIEPEFRAFLAMMRSKAAVDLNSLPLDEALSRARAVAFARAPITFAGIRSEDLLVRSNGLDVPVRLYLPPGEGPLPVVVNMHGGGFVVGSVNMDDHRCSAFADGLKCAVVSVEYRLAPEHPFPAAFDDCYAVLEWIGRGEAPASIDRSRIALVGSSAGGSLAAALTLGARDRGGPGIAGQVLIYPMVDDSLDQQSYQIHGKDYYPTRSDFAWYYAQYRSELAATQVGYYAPLAADDLANLPPALVMVAEFDPLRDEANAYAGRLRQAGVQVTETLYGGTVHGFVSISANANASRLALAQVIEFLKGMF